MSGEGDREEEVEEDAGEGAMEEGDDDAGEGDREEEEEEEEEDSGEGGIEEEEMEVDEEEEEEEDSNVDFHPLLLMQRSPSAERESGGSSTLVRETEEDAEDDEGKRLRDEKHGEDGNFDEGEGAAQQMFRGSEEFISELDGDDKFFELATDYEEEEFEDVEQEEEDREYLEGCLRGMDYGETSYVEEAGDPTALQNLGCLDGGKGCSVSAPPGDIACGGGTAQENNVDEDYTVDEEYIAPYNAVLTGEVGGGEVVRSDESDGEREDMMDPISRRTRARYSLTDMSLNQLETFLQESDEEEDFQTVAEKEEYEKFLRAVLEDEESGEQPEQSSRKEEEDDEDEDMDFDVEIEEALESDDTTESVRRSRIETRKRPETREKKRRRAQFYSRGPLRHLLPHVLGSFGNDFKRSTITSTAWPINGKRGAPVSGFTAHQIGQLYCLMHEHVQLLVQVHALCAFDPTKEQIAKDTHRMLQEIVKQRESVISWKKTAFPDFCFRPPYTHPSPPVEGENPATLLHSLTPPDTTTYTSTSCGQSGPISSNMTFPHNAFGQNTSPGFPPAYTLAKSLSQVSPSAQHYATSDIFSQQSTVTSQSWQEGFHPLGPWNPNPDPRQRAPSALEGASASLTRALTSSYSAGRGSSGVDPESLIITRPVESGDGTFHPPFHGSCDDLPSLAADCSSPGVVSSGPLPSGMVQTATTFREGGPMCKSMVYGPNERVKSAWAPVVSGSLRSLLDVAPLVLVRDFLTNISQVVQKLRQRHVEFGAHKFERVPMFAMAMVDDQDQSIGRSFLGGTRSHLLGDVELLPACLSPPQVKKTMAAALVESTKKQDFAPVPKEIAAAVQQFVPYFNIAMFPHKPPPVSTTSRILFTEAEDELLAMGMMEFNHDWSSIQQKFLPSKTVHQVFVRQKNRTSSKALDNSIKAVHRMKASPLTDWERKAIQEGLNFFKHDWNKVWSHCVKHRDPATLQRQWRIAAGTQKSYKTSETSKERRRVYEASRRQKIAAQKANHALSSTEDVRLPGGGRDEGNNSTAENNEAGGPDSTYNRAAFTDDWALSGTPVLASDPTIATAERQRKLQSKKRKPKTQSGNRSSTSFPWLNEKAVKNDAQHWKQTVKLAPGLPSVKLPPHVQVLSRSQVQPQPSFSFARMVPPTSQWEQWTSQRLEQSGFSLPTNCQPLPQSNRATQAEEVSTSQQLTVSSSLPNPKRKQTSSKKNSRVVHLPPAEDHGHPLLPHPVGEPAMGSNLPSQSLSLGYWQHGHGQGGNMPYFVEPAGSGLPSIQRVGSLPTTQSSSRRKTPQKTSTSTAQVGSEYQDGIVSHISSLSVPMESVRCHFSEPSVAATTASGSHGGSELQFCAPRSPIQSSSYPALGAPLPTGQRVRSKGMVASESLVPGSDPVGDLTTRMHNGKTNAQESAKQGDPKARKNAGRKSKKAVRENSGEAARKGKLGTFPSILKGGSPQFRTFFGAGDISDPCTNIHQFSSRNTVRNRNRKDHKHQDFLVEEGSQAPLFREQNIVMEREELSDSEDEPDAGVEFEHEEMGDSDKEAEVEVRITKQSRACQSNCDF